MTLKELEKALLNSYEKELCYGTVRENWTEENKTLGMCAITSLIVNDYFKGEIAKIKVDGISHYFNIINGNILKIIFLFISIIGIFIGSYKIGKVSNQKGYVNGIKYGSIWVILFLIINLIIKSFTLLSIVYFVILMFISILGSILGINNKIK